MVAFNEATTHKEGRMQDRDLDGTAVKVDTRRKEILYIRQD